MKCRDRSSLEASGGGVDCSPEFFWGGWVSFYAFGNQVEIRAASPRVCSPGFVARVAVAFVGGGAGFASPELPR